MPFIKIGTSNRNGSVYSKEAIEKFLNELKDGKIHLGEITHKERTTYGL